MTLKVSQFWGIFCIDTDSALVGFLDFLTGRILQNVLRKVNCLKRDLTHRYWIILIPICQVPLSFWRREVHSDFVKSGLLENLRKLQQAPVRAMSENSSKLWNALADTKRYSGILQKDFLNISPEQAKISFLKCLALYLSFQKKYSMFCEPRIIR